MISFETSRLYELPKIIRIEISFVTKHQFLSMLTVFLFVSEYDPLGRISRVRV